MDYRKLTQVLDGKFKKGDVVIGTLPNGLKVKGSFVEETTTEYKLKSLDGKTFYNVTKESAESSDLDKRESDKALSQLKEIDRKIAQLQDKIDETLREQETDPDVLADPDNSDNPAVNYYANVLAAQDKRMRCLQARKESIESKIK